LEKRAQQRMYQINPDAMFELEAWSKHITQLWNQRFDALERVLEGEKKKIAQNEMERRSIMANQKNQRKEVTITRMFDAPRELVFKAWTDPRIASQKICLYCCNGLCFLLFQEREKRQVWSC
jgi:hypothetical protein